VVNDDGFETAVLNLLEPGMQGKQYWVYVEFYVQCLHTCVSHVGKFSRFVSTGMTLGTDDGVAARYEEVLKVSLFWEFAFFDVFGCSRRGVLWFIEGSKFNLSRRKTGEALLGYKNQGFLWGSF
jgi:hypothetical protein